LASNSCPECYNYDPLCQLTPIIYSQARWKGNPYRAFQAIFTASRSKGVEHARCPRALQVYGAGRNTKGLLVCLRGTLIDPHDPHPSDAQEMTQDLDVLLTRYTAATHIELTSGARSGSEELF
jgi:hypothetical protein